MTALPWQAAEASIVATLALTGTPAIDKQAGQQVLGALRSRAAMYEDFFAPIGYPDVLQPSADYVAWSRSALSAAAEIAQVIVLSGGVAPVIDADPAASLGRAQTALRNTVALTQAPHAQALLSRYSRIPFPAAPSRFGARYNESPRASGRPFPYTLGRIASDLQTSIDEAVLWLRAAGVAA